MIKTNPTSILRKCNVMLRQLAQLTNPEIGQALREIAAVIGATDSKVRELADFGKQNYVIDRLTRRVNELVTEHPDYSGMFKPDDGRQFCAADLEDPDSPVHEAVRKAYRARNPNDSADLTPSETDAKVVSACLDRYGKNWPKGF